MPLALQHLLEDRIWEVDMRVLIGFRKWVGRLCLALGVLGAVMIMLMMFMVAYDVIGRDTMRRPFVGSYELVEYAMVLGAFSAYGVAQARGFHVKIDVLVNLLPDRVRAVLDSITLLMMLGFFGVAAWLGYDQVLRSIEGWQHSSVLMIPRWPVQSMVVIGYGSFCLCVFADFLLAVGRALGLEVEAKQAPQEELNTI